MTRLLSQRVLAEIGRCASGMRATVVFALTTAIGLVSCASAVNPVQITNLKQGLMRPIENGGWEVYQEGSRFDVVENGQCVIEGTPTSCMWFGIVFDYMAPSSTTTLKCIWTSSAPIVSVTPNRVLERSTTKERVDLVLGERNGHEVRPGYVEVPWHGGESHLKYECSHQGAVVFSVEFELAGSR